MTNKKKIYSLFNRIGLDGITDFTNEFQAYCTTLSNENLFDNLVDFVDSLQDKINVINNKVLDLGCGFGIHSIILSCYNNDVIGIDPAEHRMSEATKLLSFIDENVLQDLCLFHLKIILLTQYIVMRLFLMFMIYMVP